MSEATYYFNSKSSDVWTDSANMIDHVLTNYASTSSDGDTETLDGNTCDGSDLGTISKVELSAYGYGDADDRIDLTPVLTGGDGDEHQTTPGVSAGWVTYVDITSDANTPITWYETSTLIQADQRANVYGINWYAQTFTPSTSHECDHISIEVLPSGSPSGTVTVALRATDESGHPTGEDLTSGTFEASSLDAGYYWVTVTVSGYSLTASTKYAIVVSFPNGDASNHVAWAGKETVYANGNREDSDDSGSSWAASSRDCAFKEGKKEWSWTDVQTLDCKVAFSKVAKGNTMHCAEVAIRVTYTPSSAYYHGLKVQGEGELALCDVGIHPLRIRKGGTTYGIELVPTDDPNASAVRIQTSSGTKAIRRYT